MSLWTRKPQETEGDYFFEGQFYFTIGASLLLSKLERNWIVRDLKRAVQEKDGLDYLQVYKSLDGKKTVWIIDNLSRTMKTDGSYSPEEVGRNNYATILLPSEY